MDGTFQIGIEHFHMLCDPHNLSRLPPESCQDNQMKYFLQEWFINYKSFKNLWWRVV